MTADEYKKHKPVHDKAVRLMLGELAAKEAGLAHQRYGYYHSPHEGLAIIQEEMHETAYEKGILDTVAEWLRGAVYHDEGNRQRKCAIDIKACALNLAQEAIHVAATAMRYEQALNAGHAEFAYITEDENRG